jgi:hypothetical protein
MNTSAREVWLPPLGREILEKILSGTPKSTLYHYTNQAGLLGIIRGREIWATHHQCLNDTQEFVHAKELLRDELKKSADTDPLIDAMCRGLEGRGLEDVNLYVASLSEERDSLAQWRAYGGPTTGFALGFRMDGIDLPSPFILARCVYEENKQREMFRTLIAEILNNLRKLDREIYQTPESVQPFVHAFPRLALHTFALLFKHPKFAEEKEFRIISPHPIMEDPPNKGEAPLDFREGESLLIPYRRVRLKNKANGFPLTEIMVGPNPNRDQSLRSVESLLRSQGLTTRVDYSSVPYRNW